MHAATEGGGASGSAYWRGHTVCSSDGIAVAVVRAWLPSSRRLTNRAPSNAMVVVVLLVFRIDGGRGDGERRDKTWKTKIPDDTKKFPHKSSHV